MKRLFTILFCATSLMWGGCSNDDDSSSVNLSKLTGIWEMYKYYDGEYDEWDKEFGKSYGYVETWEFCDDGSGQMKVVEYGSSTQSEWSDNFVYTVEETMLTITFSPYERGTLSIEKLTSNELVLIDSEGEWTDKMYFKRVG